MKNRVFSLTALALLTCSAAQAVDVVLVDEDFESYADTAAMKAVWSIVGGDTGKLVDQTYTQFISLDDVEPRPVGAQAFPTGGKGAEHLGGGVLEINVANLNGGQPIVPSATQSIVLEGDLFDVGGLGNKRLSIGLRNTTPAANLIETGLYNTTPVGYEHRAILFPGTVENPNPNWKSWTLPIELDRPNDLDEITTIGDIGQAWHHYRVTITPETLTYEIDLKRDGINAATGLSGFDGTVTYNVTTPATGYNSIRFGSPSGVASAGNGFYGGAIFDNIKLSLVEPTVDPEPLVGDYTGDGLVDAADYTAWRDTLGQSVTPGTGADGNGNGIIDGPGEGSDYAFWASNYGATPAPSSSVTIPEPTSMVLVALGLVAVARRR